MQIVGNNSEKFRIYNVVHFILYENNDCVLKFSQGIIYLNSFRKNTLRLIDNNIFSFETYWIARHYPYRKFDYHICSW